MKVLSLLLALLVIGGTALADEDAIASRVSSMTLEDKVGQLFIIRPESLILSVEEPEGATSLTDEMRENYARYPAGGFALFKKNLTGPEQLTSFADDLHSLGDVMLTIDEEGGRIARIANHGAFDVSTVPSMQDIATSGDPKDVYDAACLIGTYLARFGIDCDFAPVADVNSNPLNTVIGDRSFGSDPALVAALVPEYIRGLADSGVLSCVKHFPGHGDTSEDTHTGYAQTLKTWDEMLACEMLPFIAGIENDCDMVMVAHIAAPAVTGTAEPATLSYTLVTEKLRGELGFDGVVITDAMEMGAIANAYSSSEAAILALQAGCDIILMPANYPEAYDAVLDAVRQGTIPESRIDQSVTRILRMKAKTEN